MNPPSNQSFSVLIVDDVELTRRSLGQILSRAGYQISLAANGQTACEIVTKNLAELAANRSAKPIDVLILDMEMPGMNGIEVLQRLNQTADKYRAKPKYHSVLKYFPDVILLTAYGTMDTVLTALRQGIVDFLEKPASPTVILETLKKHLEKRFQMIQQAEQLERMQQKTTKRPAAQNEPPPTVVHFAGLFLDNIRRQVRSGDKSIHLTPTEARLMNVLMGAPEKVFTHIELVRVVQGYNEERVSAAEIMRPLVSRLRQKLDKLPDPADPAKTCKEWVTSVRSTGYMIEQPGRQAEEPPAIN